jgi:hypothetical protein
MEAGTRVEAVEALPHKRGRRGNRSSKESGESRGGIGKVTMNEWISVEDHLPRDKQVVLGCSRDQHYAFVARYIGGREFHDFFKNWVNVDYWMPMPEVKDFTLHERPAS